MGKGLGGFVSGIFGSENEEKSKGYNVDPNAYQYAGRAGAADEAANRYADAGEAAQGRQATPSKTVGVNYAQADGDRQRALQARQGQNSLAQIMSNRAMGGQPSVAQMQATRQMQQSQAQQASLAGSARGAGGLAAAQRNAAFNMANNASDISGQAQINAAQERRDDTNAAASMYGAMRGGDQNAQSQDAQQAQFQTQSMAQQNQFNAGLRDSQAARNDQFQLGMTQNEMGVRNAQMTGQMNQQAQQSANTLGQQQINAQVSGQNAAMNQKNAEGVLGLAQKGVGAIAGALAKGGPATEGKPYLVGEKGPELVVPRKDGYVLTADQTRAALAGSPSSTINQLFDRGHDEARGASLSSIMARCGGGPMPARADGGPVESGGEAPPPAVPPPGYTPPISTWGTGQPDANAYAWQAARDDEARMAPYDDLSQRIAAQRESQNATASRVNETVKGIDAKDNDAIWNADYKDRHRQAMTPAEDDAAEEARYRQSLDKKQARDDAKTKRKKSLTDILTTPNQDDQGSRVDVAYHGGGGYVPPQLIQIAGARAMGGPISGGGLVPLTPMRALRPDEAQPMMGPGSGAGATSYEVLNGTGGEDVAASGKAMSDFATKYQSNPVASPTGFGGAREDGGPVDGSEEPDAYTRGVAEGRQQAAKEAVRKTDAQKKTRADARDDAASEWVRDLAYAGGAGVGSPAVGLATQAPMLANYIADKAEAARLRDRNSGVVESSNTSGAGDLAHGEGRAIIPGEPGVSAYVPANRRAPPPDKQPQTTAGIAQLISALFARRGK